MSNLPPLANLLAIRDEDPRSLAAITGHLTTSGDFDTVFHPAPHWVCAQKYLPDSVPDPAEARAAGLVFCEGRDEIESGHERNTRARFEALAAVLNQCRQRVADLPPPRLHEFPGDFTFLHFGPQTEVTAVRSCGGLVPIYWYTQGPRIALATRLDLLIRYAGVPAEPDPLTAAIWAVGWPGFPDGRAPIAGVRVLERP